MTIYDSFQKRICLILIAATVCSSTLIIFPQAKHKTVLQSISFSDSKQKIVDLTKLVNEKCTESLRKEVGENTVEMRFQPEFRKEAEKIAGKLEAVIIETQKALAPLEIGDLKLYLLKMDKVPANYKITEVLKGRKFYLDLLVLKTTHELDLNNCNSIEVCTEIFGTIPHELTHGVLDDLITRKKTRWFDDGLADYVGDSVYERLSPDNYRNEFDSSLLLVSLHRHDIRQNIFFWDEPTSRLFKISRRGLSNEIYNYLAAHQIIKEIIASAEAMGVKNPLSILLTRLKEHREKSAKLVSSDEIISIIQQNLKVDPKAIGELDAETQQGLVDEAISLLSKDDLGTEKKSHSLYILAGIDGIKLPDRWINYLLDQVYQNKTSDENQREIAATALVVRFGQDGFDEVLEKYLSRNPKQKLKSLKKAKAELAKLSFRPIPE